MFRYRMNQTSGLTFGGLPLSLLARPMIISLEPGKFIQLIIGYGNQGVKNKRKFFFWLWLKDWLNTRALLKRKNMALEDYT